MAAAIKISKKGLMMFDGVWVTNGHWIVKKTALMTSNIKLPEPYQILIENDQPFKIDNSINHRQLSLEADLTETIKNLEFKKMKQISYTDICFNLKNEIVITQETNERLFFNFTYLIFFKLIDGISIFDDKTSMLCILDENEKNIIAALMPILEDDYLHQKIVAIYDCYN